MREIKFRVWHKTSKKWENHFNHKMLNNEFYDCQQFTGLKDKNGKDCYEGDLLSYKDGYKVQVEWKEESANFQLKVLPDGIKMSARYIPEMEIIGNIYKQK